MKACHTNLYTPGVGKWSHDGGGGAGRSLDKGTHEAGDGGAESDGGEKLEPT